MTHEPVVTYTAYRQADVSGVIAGRIGALLVDFVVIGVLCAIFAFALLVMGVFTFGLSWLLLAPLWPTVALLYNGITISGPRRGTIGQRMFGVEIRTVSGRTAPFIVAAAHAVLFYVSVTTLTPLVLLIGLVREDRRLLHDLLAGLIAVRRGS
jgi:uncharacterized RDD family membrane protein YckC